MSIPTIAWLGDPPPQQVEAALSDIASIHLGWSPDVLLVLVAVPSGREPLRNLPYTTARPPIIATNATKPTTRERLAWIKAGAEDLVSYKDLAGAVARRFKTVRRQRAPSKSSPRATAQPSAPAPQPAVAGSPAPAAAASPQAPRPTPPPARLDGKLRAFAPRTDTPPAAEITGYIQTLGRYIEQRGTWLAGSPDTNLASWLEVQHQRCQISPTPNTSWVDTLSQIHGQLDQALGWAIALRSFVQNEEKPAFFGSRKATMVSAGTDGLVLDSPVSCRPGQLLLMAIASDESQDAILLVEVCWQRRCGMEQWQIGCLIHELRKLDK